MSIAMHPRPHRSAWEGVAGGMAKAGAPAWLRRAGQRIGEVITPDHPLRAIPRQGANWIRAHPKISFGVPPVAGAGLIADTEIKRHAAGQAAAASAAAAAAPKPPPPAPSDLEAGLTQARDWSAGHWPLLAGLGVGAGAVGLGLKARADREREEEEQALLGGLHKEAALALAAEFPVQVGFLARCGERRLSGPEVRAAVEKCAAISDGIAEDWIRFFAAAAGSEAGTSSGLVKAADPLQDPGAGLDATAAEALRPKPPPATAPAPPPLLAAPTAATPGTSAAGPSAPTITPSPRVQADAAAKQQIAAPTAPEPAPEPAPAAPPTHRQERALRPGQQLYRANVQAQAARDAATRAQAAGPIMARAPTDEGLAAREAWTQQFHAASRAAGQPGPGQAPAMARLKELAANEPTLAPAGAAGAGRELPGRAQLQNLAREGAHDADPWNQWYGTTLDRAAQGQEAQQNATNEAMDRERQQLAAGMPAEEAAQERQEGLARAQTLNTLGTANDRSTGEALLHGATELPGAMGGLVAAPAMAGWDTYRGLRRGQWDYQNTIGAATEFADPITQGLGVDPIRGTGREGLFGRDHARGTGVVGGAQTLAPGSAAYLAGPERQQELANSAGSVTATNAKRLRELGRQTGDANYGRQAWLNDNSELFLSSLGLMGMAPGAGAAGAGGAGLAAPGSRLAGMLGGGRAANAVNALTRSRGFGVGSALAETPFGQAAAQLGMKSPTLAKAVAVPGNFTRYALQQAGTSPIEGGMLFGAEEAYNKSKGGQKAQIQERMDEAARGDVPIRPETIPEGLSPEQADAKVTQSVDGSIEAQQALRRQTGRPPLSAPEVDALRTRLTAPITARGQALVASTVPGMANPDGSYNPRGTIDTKTPDYDENNLHGFMAARGKGIATQFVMDHKDLTKIAEGMEPGLKQKLLDGDPLGPQDMDALQASLQAKGLDAGQVAAQSQRAGQANLLLTATNDPKFNGSIPRMRAYMNTPEAPLLAAQKNPTLAQAGADLAAKGGAPDPQTGLAKVWSDLGPTGQMLAFGGIALGAIGLMNAFSGGGGLGSILMTLLGGGGLLLAANKGGMLPAGMSGAINPLLRSLGLSSLAGGQPGAAPGAGAPAVSPTGARSAARQVGVKLDPAAVDRLMAGPASGRIGALQQAIDANQVSGDDLATAAMHWNGSRDKVMAALREKLQMPGLTEAQGQAFIDAYGGLPEQQRAGYNARWFG